MLIDIAISSSQSQSSILFYIATQSLQSFTTFDNSLFQQIWLDLSEFFCKYELLTSFSHHIDEEFVKAKAQLKKELE